jgi:hypothetical protein
MLDIFERTFSMGLDFTTLPSEKVRNIAHLQSTAGVALRRHASSPSMGRSANVIPDI